MDDANTAVTPQQQSHLEEFMNQNVQDSKIPAQTGSSTMAPTQVPSFSHQAYAPSFHPSTDADGGLELLFAASLIQQKGESAKQPAGKALSSCSENESAATGDSPLHASPDLAETSDFVEPSERDVLCGRGGFINKHVGNQMYRKVVDYNKTIYKQVPKRHRILVSQSIVQTIEKHGGRFLQPVNGHNGKNQAWKCIQFRRAVQKTSQALREPSTDAMDTSGTSESLATEAST